MHLSAAAAIVPAACHSLPSNLTSDHSFWGPIARPIADILAGFYALVPNYGVAIILLSVAWMILIAPLTLKSTRSMLAMQRLQPEIKRLQAEHKNDRAALSQATMDLYKEHKVSPFGSCLPSILPLPVFFALFRVIDGLSHHVKFQGVECAAPSYLNTHTAMYKAIVVAGGQINAFGLDLSKNALSGHSSFLAALPYFVLLLIMIGTQYLQTAQMMNRNPANQDNPQMKFMKYLPIIFGVICVRFPAGVILYYAVSSICRIGQQTLMYRFDPKVKALAQRDEAELEALESRYDKASKAVTPAGSGRGGGSGRLNFREMLAQSKDQAQSHADARAKQKTATKATSAPKGRPTPARGEAGAKPGAGKREAGQKTRPAGTKAAGGKLATTKTAVSRSTSVGRVPDGQERAADGGSSKAARAPAGPVSAKDPGPTRSGNGSANRARREAERTTNGATASASPQENGTSAPKPSSGPNGSNGSKDGTAGPPKPRTGARTGAQSRRRRDQ